MDAHRRPRAISFGGGGFLGVYHVGVVKCLEERAPELLDEFCAFYGASAGAMTATCAVCKVDIMLSYKFVKKTFEALRELGPLGFLHPSFDLYSRLRSFFDGCLPPNAHRQSRGKLYISLSVVSSLRNKLVSNFTTRKELIDVSC